MVARSFGWKPNKIADDFLEDDMGWRWIIQYWELLANNPCQLEGLMVLKTELEGLIELEEEIEGMVGSG